METSCRCRRGRRWTPDPLMKLWPAVIITPDIGEALAFYRDTLGLTLKVEHPGI